MVYEDFSNQKSFNRTQICFLRVFKYKLFSEASTMRGHYVSLKYPYMNLKKMVCPKKRLDAALGRESLEG